MQSYSALLSPDLSLAVVRIFLWHHRNCSTRASLCTHSATDTLFHINHTVFVSVVQQGKHKDTDNLWYKVLDFLQLLFSSMIMPLLLYFLKFPVRTFAHRAKFRRCIAYVNNPHVVHTQILVPFNMASPSFK